MISFVESRNDLFSVIFTQHMTYPLHQHNHLELFYLIAGRSEVTVGKDCRMLEEGDLALIFPGQLHSYRCDDSTQRGVLLICDPALTSAFSSDLSAASPLDPFLPAHTLHPDVPYAMEGILREFYGEENTRIYSPFLQLILARSFPLLELRKDKSPGLTDLTHRVVSAISTQFREELSLGELAKQLGVSKYHLSRVFSEKMGTSFHEYVNSIRLRYACVQLAETEKPVTQVAVDAGFESQRTFYRVFQNHFSCTPLGYRAKKEQMLLSTPQNQEEKMIF